MKKIRTHYDNLKVSRDAPPEVMRAAYKSLAAKYHPDKNKNSPRSQRAMKIINESYSVLSDPEKRKIHDAWIADNEAEEVNFSPHGQRFGEKIADEEQEPVVPEVKEGRFKIEAIFIILLFSILIVIVFNQRQSSESLQQIAEQQRQTQPTATGLDTRGVPEGWSVRLAGFPNADYASALLTRLQEFGHPAYIRRLESSQGIVMTWVFVGPLANRSDAQVLVERLQQDFQLSGGIERYEI